MGVNTTQAWFAQSHIVPQNVPLSSGNYRADRQEDNTFRIKRMATKHTPEIQIGTVQDEAAAKRVMDWLVSHDRGVVFSFSCFLRGNMAPLMYVVKNSMQEATR